MKRIRISILGIILACLSIAVNGQAIQDRYWEIFP